MASLSALMSVLSDELSEIASRLKTLQDVNLLGQGGHPSATAEDLLAGIVALQDLDLLEQTSESLARFARHIADEGVGPDIAVALAQIPLRSVADRLQLRLSEALDGGA